MHTGSERRARINVQDHLSLILRFDFLPGRNYQKIVDVKLMEILLPIVDPVDILGFIYRNAAFPDLTEHAQTIQLFLHLFADLRFGYRLAV